MKRFKVFLIIIILPLFGFTGFHKYYVSVTQINHIEDKKSIQIISRIFIDDFERLLRERYDEEITLAEKNELATVNTYIERYLKDKLRIKINNEFVNINFIGKEYDTDIIRCYLEINQVKNIKSIEINNQILFDIFDEQQNIVKTKINSKQKSFILIPQKVKALLNFD